MNRNKKILRNITILLILFILRFNSFNLYLTPKAAHEASERSIHYGPSEVTHIQDFDKGKFILSKYDRWISCNTVRKSMFFFWTFGSQVTGIEVDETKPLDYTWSYSRPNFKCYGIINDNRIDKVEVYVDDGSVLSQTEFYDDMFLLTWVDEVKFSSIKAYDSHGNILFEDDRLR
ncbi:MAG: hypothetical protein RIN55_08020 [Tissierellaceae bacterium]|nr:hypothetical protein [Tissierellaceae bacterium]